MSVLTVEMMSQIKEHRQSLMCAPCHSAADKLFLALTGVDMDAYMMTHVTKRKVRLFRCTVDDISPLDILHSLPGLNRYCNHTPSPLSVGAHLLEGLEMAVMRGQQVVRHWLLHDAEETYLTDLPRPIKKAGINYPYELAAHHLRSVIAKRFDLEWTPDMMAIVKEIDNGVYEKEKAWRAGGAPLFCADYTIEQVRGRLQMAFDSLRMA